MEFFFAVFFLLFYYLRPQDWVTGLIGLNLIKPLIVGWLTVLFVARSRTSPLPGILKTPHDWLILTYMCYVVWTAPDSKAALTGFLPLVAFYALTLQSVNTWPRLLSYLKWWTIALAIIALLGVLIPLGIDPTGGKEYLAEYGRLALGTWLHDNPNSLGHSVIIVIPASYLLFFWRGTAVGKYLIFPVIAGLACWCVYQTGSKGSFLVGGMLTASIFVVGRPKIVQVAVVVTTLTIGVSALSFLPRMSQMSDLRADEGVQGRLLAWEMARGVSKTHPTGAGWQQFVALIDWRENYGYMVYDLPKATHSSYVQVGADLGQYGLFIYLGGLWCVLHTLLKFRPENDMEDRCRRILWILLLSTVISGWMINRQYHTEYFLLLAAAAALHRLAKGRELEVTPVAAPVFPEDGSPDSRLPEGIPAPELKAEDTGAALAFTTEEEDEEKPPKPLWNKFGLLDLGACLGLTWLTFWLWDYIIVNL